MTFISQKSAIGTSAQRSNLGRSVRGLGTRLKTSALLRSGIFWIGATPVIFWCVVAVFAPFFTSYDPNAQDLMALSSPEPSYQHFLGTDQLGRDVWSRIAFGSRTVLLLAPAALLVSYAIGIIIGLVSGYFRTADLILTRASDILLSLPVIVLYIVLITALGPSFSNIVLAIAVSTAPAVGRIVRGMVIDIRDREFVDAARIRGESKTYIVVGELLPNMTTGLMVDCCLRLGYTIMKIGALGFLGLGLPPPDPDWGGMVKESVSFMLVYPHMALFPCIAIATIVIGFNLIADALAAHTFRA